MVLLRLQSFETGREVFISQVVKQLNCHVKFMLLSVEGRKSEKEGCNSFQKFWFTVRAVFGGPALQSSIGRVIFLVASEYCSGEY